MALNFVALANGDLPLIAGAIYTVGSGKFGVVRSITVVNHSGADRTINIYVTRSAVRNRVSSTNQILLSGYKTVEDNSHVLGAGDKIEGDANGDHVSYVIEGTEETIEAV